MAVITGPAMPGGFGSSPRYIRVVSGQVSVAQLCPGALLDEQQCREWCSGTGGPLMPLRQHHPAPSTWPSLSCTWRSVLLCLPFLSAPTSFASAVFAFIAQSIGQVFILLLAVPSVNETSSRENDLDLL